MQTSTIFSCRLASGNLWLWKICASISIYLFLLQTFNHCLGESETTHFFSVYIIDNPFSLYIYLQVVPHQSNGRLWFYCEWPPGEIQLMAGNMFQSSWHVGPMLIYCWATVWNAGPAMYQHWLVVSCCLFTTPVRRAPHFKHHFFSFFKIYNHI